MTAAKWAEPTPQRTTTLVLDTTAAAQQTPATPHRYAGQRRQG
jgi:hypothetical protein